MKKKQYKINWIINAVQDLQSIIEYILRDSVASAITTENRIKDAVSKLADHPNIGRTIPELEHLGSKRWREIIVKPYRVIYSLQSNTVYIHCVIDGRRNVRSQLYERLIR